MNKNISETTNTGKESVKCIFLKKDGVALVLVLGLMAVFMITAVAFSISMRVERRGASNYRYTIQAKHMLWSGLAAAIEDINNKMDTGSNFYLYPPWDTLSSTGLVPARVLSKSILQYIPGQLQGTVVSNKPSWQYLQAGGLKRGSFAYMAINCSGLLDANKAGGNTNRTTGLDPSEITITNLPEISDATIFLEDRRRHVRYETLGEMTNLNAGLKSGMPDNFALYSLSPEGERIDPSNYNVKKKINIGGDLNSLISNRVNIVQGLISAGIDANQADFVFYSLLDYIDENCIPDGGGLLTEDVAQQMPLVEAVPMISEFMVTNRFDVSGGARARPRLNIELHYPFVKETKFNFQLGAKWRLTFTLYTNHVQCASNQWTYTSDMMDIGEIAGAREKFIVMQNITFPTLNPPILPIPGGVSPTNVEARLKCEVAAWVIEKGTKKIVDAAPYPTNQFIVLQEMIANSLPPSGSVDTFTGKECMDPRFNWDPTHPRFWRSYKPGRSHTLGTTNYWTLTLYGYDNTPPTKGIDEGLAMYVSDAGRVTSPGELGNLLRGKDPVAHMLRTIRLFDIEDAGTRYPRDKIFETFCITNGFLRGRVNLNTKNDKVLASVFSGVPIGGPDSTNRVSPAISQQIATQIISANTNFWDIGDIGNLRWRTILPGKSDCERDLLIANASGLLTTRHNLFLIAVATESYSEELGGDEAMKGRIGQTLAGARSIAEIWRDPFPMCDAQGNTLTDKNGKRIYRCFVRFLKILED
jgi:hypothetical protein